MAKFRPSLGDPNQAAGDYSPPVRAELEQVLASAPVDQSTALPVDTSTSAPVSRQRRIVARKAGPVAKFGVYVPVDLDRRLAKLAFDSGNDRSTIVTAALQLYLDRVGA